MRTERIPAAVLLSFSGVLCAASCIQGPEETPGVGGATDNEAPVIETKDDGEEPAEPLDTWINCRGLDAVQCMEKCAEAGAPCAPRMKHPQKPAVGWGDLYMCKTGFPTRVCSYHYTNGDECIYFHPFGRIPWCVYVGGRS